MSFLNAPRCVGSAYEIFERSFGPNVYGYNNTFMSAIDALNFGSLNCEEGCDDALKYGTLKIIKDRGQLNCGVYIPPHLTSRSMQTEISTKYCFLVAAAIFQGNPLAANVTYLGSEDFSVDFLPDFPAGFDIVAGVNWEDYVPLDSEISKEGLEGHGNFYLLLAGQVRVQRDTLRWRWQGPVTFHQSRRLNI